MVRLTRKRARRVAGVATAVLFAAAIPAAALTPWASITAGSGLHREPVPVVALPEPTASLLSCVGPVLAVGRDAEDASLLTDAAPQDVAAATGPGQPDATAARMAAPDVSGGAGSDALTALPADGVRTDVAAAGSSRLGEDDLAGFAASACAPPLRESWLVGGSAATGAADLVLLANPSGVAAEVDVTVYGAEGATQPDAAAGIIVAPRTQRVLSLASLALGEERPVVRVNATGAPIQAALQTSLTRTLLPGGVDQVGTTAPPAERLVVPSFRVTVAPGQEGASEPATVVRLLAPSEDADVTIQVTPIDDGAPVSEAVSLPAGVPAEIELAGLEPGDYRLEVSATAPVVAAVWSTTGFGEGSDFAWHTVPSVLSVPSLVAVAVGPDPVIGLSNEGDEDARITLAGPSGEEDVLVRPGTSVLRSVQDAAVYRLDIDGGRVRANVTYLDTDALAGYDVIPADAAAEPVTVYPQ